MYYLLEDNRIVDSKKENVYVNEYQGFKWLHKNNEHKTCLGLIFKQSENVFNLLETGDLVKYKTMLMDEFRFFIIEIKAEFFKTYKQGFYTILAVYKPDSKGNYIKVWEVKEEDE